MEGTATKQLPVRIANSADAEEITLLINAAFRPAERFFVEGDRIGVPQVVDYLDTGKFLLVEDKGTLIGCVYIEPRGDRAYLGLLSVAPSRQHSGLGSLLMLAGEDYCTVLGCHFMDIKMVNLRDELFDFYRRRGYVETGTSSFPANIETTQPCHFIDMSKTLRTSRG